VGRERYVTELKTDARETRLFKDHVNHMNFMVLLFSCLHLIYIYGLVVGCADAELHNLACSA